jgi:CheY-like chemotaxis protein
MLTQNLRILLIDDNKHGLVARRTVLEQLGHHVCVALNGQDGIEKFGAGAFDLVVTDYRMPELTGQQVIRRIRQQNPKVPIVLLSGFVEALGLTEQSTGADIVLSKGPGEVQDLIRAITRLTKTKKRLPPKPPGSAAGPLKRTRRAAIWKSR